jgi:SAM-dependent methyltransferase
VNENHQQLCPSPQWAQHLRDDVLATLVDYADLGTTMLEIGPGPGAATEWLRTRVSSLTAVEIDPVAAKVLMDRYEGTNVNVVVGDAAKLDLGTESFDSVGCFTMLHHVPEVHLQNSIFREVLRVLRPGGVFLGSDSLASSDLHHFHAGDTYNPIDPAALLVRLQTLGFDSVTLIVDGNLKFIARKPEVARKEGCPT